MISVSHLYHSYTNDDNYAVKDVSFEIQRGEIFGFLGPSGAGKSTTQNVLIGLLPLQQGEVTIDGEDIRKGSSKLFNSIGVSFEQANVYKKLTGLENLEFFARMFEVPTEDPMQLLKMVGLEDAARQRASEYSKGMLQRLVFVRSMLNRPKIWFLDEPTAGLDPGTASVIKDIILSKKEEGTTIFLTTHNMYIADELCDRVAFITDGSLSVIDSPRNLKLKHGQKFVQVEYIEDGETRSEMLSLNSEHDRKRLAELSESAQIETMHTQEATLEQIFIKVTGKELK